jgi:hypothetical protein
VWINRFKWLWFEAFVPRTAWSQFAVDAIFAWSAFTSTTGVRSSRTLSLAKTADACATSCGFHFVI